MRTVYTLMGALALTVFGSAAFAAPITKTLTVNVFDVCDDSGNNCAPTGPSGDTYFAAEVNAIWAQAGIGVTFVTEAPINSSLYLNSTGDANFPSLAALEGGPSNSVVNLFLVNQLNGSNTTFGEGYVGAGGAVIAMQSVMNYGSGGRLDTIAHELGHNLGLVPGTSPEYNPASPNHDVNPGDLMADGGYRLTPTTIGDIAPNGLGYDFIPQDQIDTARGSSLLQDAAPDAPEPSSIALAGFALLALFAVRRRLAA